MHHQVSDCFLPQSKRQSFKTSGCCCSDSGGLGKRDREGVEEDKEHAHESECDGMEAGCSSGHMAEADVQADVPAMRGAPPSCHRPVGASASAAIASGTGSAAWGAAEGDHVLQRFTGHRNVQTVKVSGRAWRGAG